MRLHVVLPFLLVLAACDKHSSPAPAASGTAHATASATTTAAPAPTSTASAAAAEATAKMVDGAKLAPLLPAFSAVTGATERVERPAKAGFAEAVYKKGKDDLATITITDTTGVAGVADDYKDSKETAAGFPLKTSGYTKSAILVASRFQVQIQSPRLKAPERKGILEKMDLKALAALK